MGIGMGGRRTLAMNKPNTPPRPKPIVPAMTVFMGQDSMAEYIYHHY